MPDVRFGIDASVGIQQANQFAAALRSVAQASKEAQANLQRIRGATSARAEAQTAREVAKATREKSQAQREALRTAEQEDRENRRRIASGVQFLRVIDAENASYGRRIAQALRLARTRNQEVNSAKLLVAVERQVERARTASNRSTRESEIRARSLRDNMLALNRSMTATERIARHVAARLGFGGGVAGGSGLADSLLAARRQAQSMNALVGQMGREIATFGRSLQTVGRSLTIYLTTPLAGAAAAALKFDQEFSNTLIKLQTIAGETAEGVAALRQEVLDLAPAVGIGPNELARGLLVIESVGFTGAAAMDILERSAKSAAVGLGDTADIARAVLSAVRSYGEEAIDASTATDQLLTAVKLGGAEATEFAGTLGRILPIAAQVGVSFAQVTSAIATFTRLGVNAEEATTGLRGILNTLINPLDTADESLRAMGTSLEGLRQSVRDRGLAETLIDLVNTSTRMGIEISDVIENVRALATAFALTGAQAGDYREILAEVEGALGSVDEAFRTTEESGVLAFRQLKAAAESFLITLAEQGGLTDLAREWANSLRDLTDSFRTLDPEMKRTITSIGAFAAATAPLLIALGILLRVLGSIASTVFRFGRFIGPGSAIAIGLALLYEGAKLAAGGVRDFSDELRASEEAAEAAAEAYDRAHTARGQFRGFDLEGAIEETRGSLLATASGLTIAEQAGLPPAHVAALRAEFEKYRDSLATLIEVQKGETAAAKGTAAALNEQGDAVRKLTEEQQKAKDSIDKTVESLALQVAELRGTIDATRAGGQAARDFAAEWALAKDLIEATNKALAAGLPPDILAQQLDNIRALHAQLARLRAEFEKLQEQQRFDDIQFENRLLELQVEAYRQGADAVREFRIEEAKLREARRLEGEGIFDPGSPEFRSRIDEAARTARLQQELEDQRKLANETSKVWDNAIDNIQRGFGDLFTNLLTQGSDAFDNLGDLLKQMFFRTVAEIVNANLFQPLFDSLRGAASGAQGGSGGGNVLGNLLSSLGLGDLLGSSVQKGVTRGLDDWFSGSISNAPSGAVGSFGGASGFITQLGGGSAFNFGGAGGTGTDILVFPQGGGAAAGGAGGGGFNIGSIFGGGGGGGGFGGGGGNVVGLVQNSAAGYATAQALLKASGGFSGVNIGGSREIIGTGESFLVYDPQSGLERISYKIGSALGSIVGSYYGGAIGGIIGGLSGGAAFISAAQVVQQTARGKSLFEASSRIQAEARGAIIGGPVGAIIGGLLYNKPDLDLSIGTAASEADFLARFGAFQGGTGGLEGPFGFVGAIGGATGGDLPTGAVQNAVRFVRDFDESLARFLTDREEEIIRAYGFPVLAISNPKRALGKFAQQRGGAFLTALGFPEATRSEVLGSQHPETIAEKLTEVLTQHREVTALIDALNGVVEIAPDTKAALEEVEVALDRIKFEGPRLGIEADIDALRETARAKLIEGFDTLISDAILTIIDPGVSAANALAETQIQRFQEAEELGADLVEVERLGLLERQELLKRLNDPIQSAIDALTFSPIGSSPTIALGAAEQRFFDVAAGIGTGAFNRNDLVNAAQTFLNLSEEFLGGPTFAAARENVLSVLESFLFDALPTSTEDSVGELQALRLETARGNAITTDILQSLLEENEAMRAELAAVRELLEREATK